MVEEHESVVSQLNKVMNSYNLLQIRLDTSNLLNEAKMYLNAEIEMIIQDASGYRRTVESIGVPKANKRGIASILNWMQMVVNPHVVQGNFPITKEGISPMYEQYIMEFQINLGDIIYINLYDYDINETEAQGIIDAIMNLIVPFMTRPIGNEERKSYGETFREIRTDTQQMKQSGGMNLFKQ